MALKASQCQYDDPIHPWNAYRAIEAKTGSYILVQDDFGKLFTNRGAVGAVTFTLPSPSASWTNKWVDFYCIADQNLLVTCSALDKIVCFNDAAADTISFQTATEKIGGGFRFVCDGTNWLCMVMLGAETQTPTIAT